MGSNQPVSCLNVNLADERKWKSQMTFCGSNMLVCPKQSHFAPNAGVRWVLSFSQRVYAESETKDTSMKDGHSESKTYGWENFKHGLKDMHVKLVENMKFGKSEQETACKNNPEAGIAKGVEKLVVARSLHGEPMFLVDYDKDAYRDVLLDKSGWDGVRIFWNHVFFGGNNPHLICFDRYLLMYGSATGTLAGFIWGNIRGHKESVTESRELIVTSRFSSTALARQVVMDKVLKDSALEGLRRMFRLGFLVSLNLAVLQTSAVYSEKYTWWSFLLAGGTAGSIYRFYLGPRAMLGGFIVGSAFGLVQAALCLPWFYFTGKNLKGLREQHLEIELRKLKEKAKREERKRRKDMKSEDFDVS